MKIQLKTILLSTLFSGLAFACVNQKVNSSDTQVTPVKKIYGIKCDKETNGVIVKKSGSVEKPMICSTEKSGWVQLDFSKNNSCFDHFKQMRGSEGKELKQALAQNDANKVGAIMIKMHNENESFLKQNPQCDWQKNKSKSSSGM